VNVNSLDKSASTPLYWACHGGHFECVKILLAEKPDLNSQNKLGDAAIHAAAYKNRLDCCAALLEAGVKLYFLKIFS